MNGRFRHGEVFDETRQGRVHLAGLFKMVRRGVLGPDVFMVIPAVVADVDVARAAILLQQVSRQNRRQTNGGVAVAFAVLIRDAEGLGPTGVREQVLGDGGEILETGDGLVEAFVAAAAGGAQTGEQPPTLFEQFGRLLIESHAGQGFVRVEVEDGVTRREEACRERPEEIAFFGTMPAFKNKSLILRLQTQRCGVAAVPV